MTITVKHVEKSGHESLCEATHVAYDPGSNVLTAFGVGPASVNGSDINMYADGRIFVMNDAGRTVSTYDLDEAKRANRVIEGRA